MASTLSCAKSRAVPDSAAPIASTRVAPAPVAPPAIEREPVARFGTKFRYASDILKEEREYWIDLPENYDVAASAKTAYPVLYLLDAERFFAQAAATVKFMSELGTIPPMIIVGIPSTDARTRDMTPTHSLKGPNGETTQRGAKSGGADLFLSALKKEIFPRIEAQYRTIPYRTVVGHSLTGLFALHAFLEDAASFNAVIAMDPSLWWDDQLLAKRAATRFSTKENLRNSIYIGTAHLDLDGDGKRPRAATEAFYRAIQSLPPPNFRSKLQSFEDESHGSVPFPAFYYGLSFTFSDYQVPMADAVKEPGYVVAHYRQFSERRGATFVPPEAAFSTVGYVLLFAHKKVDEAIALLEENVRIHPSSPQAHEYLGEAFLVKDDKGAAIRCFERVLQLKPGDEEATKHLKSLRAK
ncbi:MAG: alpha/beta hydrolase-fold protein [Polyangiaceae bacterium]